SDGTLYIATTSGGSGNAGVVSKLKPDGTLTVLHDFSPATPQGLVYVNADGGDPVDIALASDGSLLGVTAAFGPQGGGTVFRITQD
ncbi:choice-of-anchor tandem repeat GloVer-containing protein, partial [Acinetobacter baumannii]